MIGKRGIGPQSDQLDDGAGNVAVASFPFSHRATGSNANRTREALGAKAEGVAGLAEVVGGHDLNTPA